MQKAVLHNQSLFDFVIQNCGTVESLINVASKNNLSITEILEAGSFFYISDSSIKDFELVEYFKVKEVIPAFGYSFNDTSADDNSEIQSLGVQNSNPDDGIVYHNQSLLDFTLQRCGSLQSLLMIALENNISITSKIVPGNYLKIPSNIIKDDEIVEFYSDRNHVPAGGYPSPNYLDYLLPNIFPISL